MKKYTEFKYENNILTCSFGHKEENVLKKSVYNRIARNKNDLSKVCKICNLSRADSPNKRIAKYGYSYYDGLLKCSNGHTTTELDNTFRAREYRCNKSGNYSNLCPTCSRINYLNSVENRIKSLGYTLLSSIPDDFNDRKTLLTIICPSGHKSTRNYESIYTYPKCSKCRMLVTSWFENLKTFGINAIEKTSRNTAKIIDGDRLIEMSISQICQRYYLDPFEIYKYKPICVSEDADRQDRIKFQTTCSNDHQFHTSRRFLIEGHGCRVCSLSQLNEPELTIGQWIENLGFRIVRRDTNIISTELDIFVPEKNVAIEYCGIRWHSMESKEKLYNKEKYERKKQLFILQHQQKMLKALEKDIHLITVFESDYLKDRQIIKAIVSDALSGVLTNTADLRYRKLLPNEKYSAPTPLYFDNNCREVEFDDEQKCYTVYDCGHLIA